MEKSIRIGIRIRLPFPRSKMKDDRKLNYPYIWCMCGSAAYEAKEIRALLDGDEGMFAHMKRELLPRSVPRGLPAHIVRFMGGGKKTKARVHRKKPLGMPTLISFTT